MPTDAARKLELNLPQPTTTTNTWTRVLTASQMKALLRSGMKQRDTVILAAPKVTTLDRRETQITAVEIKTILDSIKQEALTPPGVQSTNGIQAQPFVTSQLSLGPTLDVVPSVAPDNSTIHLTATVKMTEFLGYGTTPRNKKKTRVWIDGKKHEVLTPLPTYFTREMQASFDVRDGQTLVLGNPTITAVSRQPNGLSVTNSLPEDGGKRLLIFITPTIIDPAGNPIHAAGKEPVLVDQYRGQSVK